MQLIWIAAAPLLGDNSVTQTGWIPATLSKRGDGKLVVTGDTTAGPGRAGAFYEVHGDGSVGFQGDDPNRAMCGCELGPYNLLVYPGWSDRAADPGVHPTFLVPWRERE